jgi:hypothetical protein
MILFQRPSGRHLGRDLVPDALATPFSSGGQGGAPRGTTLGAGLGETERLVTRRSRTVDEVQS